MSKKVLGRGLSALLENADTDITSIEPKALHSIAEIQINQIIANPFQPRIEFDEEALNELASREQFRASSIFYKPQLWSD